MTPFAADDLTTVVEQKGTVFIVMWSPETAEHDPDYRELGRFKTKNEAVDFLSAG